MRKWRRTVSFQAHFNPRSLADSPRLTLTFFKMRREGRRRWAKCDWLKARVTNTQQSEIERMYSQGCVCASSSSSSVRLCWKFCRVWWPFSRASLKQHSVSSTSRGTHTTHMARRTSTTDQNTHTHHNMTSATHQYTHRPEWLMIYLKNEWLNVGLDINACPLVREK